MANDRKPRLLRLILAVVVAAGLAVGFNYLRAGLNALWPGHFKLVDYIAAMCFAVPCIYWVLLPIARVTTGVRGEPGPRDTP